MQILIYDDDKEAVEKLKELLVNYFLKRKMQYTISICKDTTYLLENVQYYDLVFLDIELHNENGIEIGKKIREHNHHVHIILTSSYTKYLIQGYQLQTDRYFLKPIHETEFNVEFGEVINRFFKDFEYFFDYKISRDKLYYKDFLYIEFKQRKSFIHLRNTKTICTSYSLKFWETKLEHQVFAKSHKSFLVNLRHVGALKHHDILLANDDLVPLSKHFKKAFHMAYMDFLQEGY